MLQYVATQHKGCQRLAYFCKKYSDSNIVNYVPQLIEAGIFQSIQEAMQPLFAQAESLLYFLNNNAVESFNNIIAKFIGGKRINFGRRDSYEGRVSAAVVQFNTTEAFSKISTVMNKQPTTIVKRMEERRKHAAEMAIKYKQEAKTSSFRNGKQSCDQNYGPNAEKPDMDKALFGVSKIEAETRDQANSEKWIAYRKKLLTASNFSKVCRLRKETPRANTLKSIMYPQLQHLHSVQYGRKNEAKALRQLEEELGKHIVPCGLLIDTALSYLGATPDGVVDDDTIVEVKCPESTKDLSPAEAIQQIPAIRRIFRGGEMNKNHHYYYQVQGQLHITNRRTALFCLWTPKGMTITTVSRNDAFWATEMEEKLWKFYEDCMLREIIDSRFNQHQPIREPPYIKTGGACTTKQ
ncbi:uncharacterized protein LOC143348738 [Colletes latitarsis]|uniref:uncharacterized protein LOC143348738 n=1 Tax=Colletes latitarsis TaxID=2605962 RepID=UPI004037092E